MKKKRRSWVVRFYRNWKEPLWGFVLSSCLVAADLFANYFQLPRMGAYLKVIEAIQEDGLRMTVMLLGPMIGVVLRHFRVKREQLFKDLVNMLVHIVDHEIRNPLMVIMTASSLMKHSDPEDAKRLQQVSEGVERIVEAVSNLGTMTNITTARFYHIKDRLESSTTPARDLKRFGAATTISPLPQPKPKSKD